MNTSPLITHSTPQLAPRVDEFAVIIIIIRILTSHNSYQLILIWTKNKINFNSLWTRPLIHVSILLATVNVPSPVCAPKLWNILPISMRDSLNVNLFKTKLNTNPWLLFIFYNTCYFFVKCLETLCMKRYKTVVFMSSKKKLCLCSNDSNNSQNLLVNSIPMMNSSSPDIFIRDRTILNVDDTMSVWSPNCQLSR